MPFPKLIQFAFVPFVRVCLLCRRQQNRARTCVCARPCFGSSLNFASDNVVFKHSVSNARILDISYTSAVFIYIYMYTRIANLINNNKCIIGRSTTGIRITLPRRFFSASERCLQKLRGKHSFRHAYNVVFQSIFLFRPYQFCGLIFF